MTSENVGAPHAGALSAILGAGEYAAQRIHSIMTMTNARKWGIGTAVVVLAIIFVTWLGTRPEDASPTILAPAGVGPSVTVDAPVATAKAGVPTSFTWTAIAPVGIIASHTAVHWGTTSRPGTLGVDVAPGASGYQNLTPDYATGSYALPRSFTAAVVFPSAGTYYYRAHALVGTTRTNIWSPEYTAAVR